MSAPLAVRRARGGGVRLSMKAVGILRRYVDLSPADSRRLSTDLWSLSRPDPDPAALEDANLHAAVAGALSVLAGSLEGNRPAAEYVRAFAEREARRAGLHPSVVDELEHPS